MTLRYPLLACISFLFCSAAQAQEPNDECVTAIPIACGETVQGSTFDALVDEAVNCGTSVGAPGV